MRKWSTRVWVFRDEADSIVGFASLGPTRRRWPPPSGEYVSLLIIPQLGIDIRFRGQPPDREWRYANQIMRHVIFEAQDWASEARRTKPNKGHFDLLMLQVHRDNHAARRLYERFGFAIVPSFECNSHFVMSRTLSIVDEQT